MVSQCLCTSTESVGKKEKLFAKQFFLECFIKLSLLKFYFIFTAMFYIKSTQTFFAEILTFFFLTATSSSSTGLCEERENHRNIADSSALVCKENGEFMVSFKFV